MIDASRDGVKKGTEVSAECPIHTEAVKSMAQAGVVGVLLPTTAYILRLHPPPARKMVEKGISLELSLYQVM